MQEENEDIIHLNEDIEIKTEPVETTNFCLNDLKNHIENLMIQNNIADEQKVKLFINSFYNFSDKEQKIILKALNKKAYIDDSFIPYTHDIAMVPS